MAVQELSINMEKVHKYNRFYRHELHIPITLVSQRYNHETHSCFGSEFGKQFSSQSLFKICICHGTLSDEVMQCHACEYRFALLTIGIQFKNSMQGNPIRSTHDKCMLAWATASQFNFKNNNNQYSSTSKQIQYLRLKQMSSATAEQLIESYRAYS